MGLLLTLLLSLLAFSVSLKLQRTLTERGMQAVVSLASVALGVLIARSWDKWQVVGLAPALLFSLLVLFVLLWRRTGQRRSPPTSSEKYGRSRS